jgi:hypothetical protein
MALFISYLLLPILAIILTILGWFIAKKNKLLKNKKFFIYIFLATLILALPSLLGFFDYIFMPFIYLSLLVFYLFVGWLNQLYINRYLEKSTKFSFGFRLFLSVILTLLGTAVFSLIFNFCNELKYGLAASSCMLTFLLIPLYRQTYLYYIEIPVEIYKIWNYNTSPSASDEKLDVNNLMVIDIELYKNTNDTDLLRITAKTSENITFANWFKIFLNDYNKKSPLNPIYYSDTEDPYGWIFFTKSRFLKRRKYIDPDLSFIENKIKPHNNIMARRVKDTIINEHNLIKK